MDRKAETKQNIMGTMPEGKLLFTMAIPMVISMLVQALYNIYDSLVVAGFSNEGVTALSLAFLAAGFARAAEEKVFCDFEGKDYLSLMYENLNVLENIAVSVNPPQEVEAEVEE